MIPFTNPISLADLRANLDEERAQMLTNMRAGDKDGTVVLRLASLAASANLRDRSIAWTQQDDGVVQMAYARVTDTAAGRVLTFAVTVENGDTLYLVDRTISSTVTTVNGTADSRPTSLDLRTTTGNRFRVVKGVRYRFALSVDTGTIGGPIIAGVQIRSLRRRR